ncbi:MAG: class I SAM-dependent methyltransferase [Acidimicrobiales bacterium]
MPEAMSTSELADSINSREWYHTIEVAPGLVTPGWFDTRAVAQRIPLPSSLIGQRCLDVGTFDGFWAFEMERRGAGEVIAVDILDPAKWDWPANSSPASIAAIGARKQAGVGFEIAHGALGSSVKRQERSVYDVDAADMGYFDFVFAGSLLLHLRDPIGALMRLRSICKGQLLIVDAINPVLSVLSPRLAVSTLDGDGRPWWWRPNVAGLVRMAQSAGFRTVGKPTTFAMPAGPGQVQPRIKPQMLRHPSSLSEALRARFGDPHAAVLTDTGGGDGGWAGDRRSDK